jgi:branched-chain amino acid transport system ATP-binding protein
VYPPTAGTLKLGGTSLAGRKPWQIAHLGISRTFQNIRLFASLTVADNVRVAFNRHLTQRAGGALLRTRGFHASEAALMRRAMELLEIFGLRRRAHDYATNLAYGDQRRLEIARALAARPKLLLLDEPAAGLNDSETDALMHTIRDIREKFQIAILLIEHNMELVMGICERIVVLNFGKTIAEGSPEEIRANDAVIEAYLGEPVSEAHL